MAGGIGLTGTRSLQETPTWALATVCFIFISFSIFIEHLIHLLSCWLKKHRKTALFEAVEKLKSVLIVLGFVSLILTVTQRWISKICIPIKLANRMLPCSQVVVSKTTKAIAEIDHAWTHNSRHLASESSTDYCDSKGMTSLISQKGLNQLSNFIFVLAVMQVVYSVITMVLGGAKMKSWKSWERETQTLEYQVATDPNRFRFTRETTFGRRHISHTCAQTSLQLWVKCFFRQFFHSVAKVDYLTLRLGFTSAHLPQGSTFNFQKYIQRSLEHDFKVVVGISPLMWFLVVIFMLVDVHGSQAYLWVSFLPLIIVLLVGTKLQVVVAQMALQLKQQNDVIKGAILVQPNDSLFWFNHPRFVLTLLHYTLFTNAFELAFFIWVTAQFGINSCYHERKDILIIRVVITITVQVICSYITLPLYALVTQMGSTFKGAVVLEQETSNAIKKWHTDVKHKRKKHQAIDSNHSAPSKESSVAGSHDSSSHHHNRSPTFGDVQFSAEPALSSSHQEIIEHNQKGKEVDHTITV